MDRNEVFQFVKDRYGTEPEYPWLKYPDYAVLRNMSGKWYGVIMRIPENKLGLDSDKYIDVINVKCDNALIGSLLNENGFFPGYHMNKKYWITMLLDGTVNGEDIKRFIGISYELT